MDSRAQAMTLDATLASLLLVCSLGIALQLTAGPNPGGITDRGGVEDHRELGAELLRTASADGTLSTVVRFWNESEGRFEGAQSPERGYADGIPSDPDTLPGTNTDTNQTTVLSFGSTLESAFEDDGSYNLRVDYADENGTTHTQQLVDQGTPDENAVTATQLVTLYDEEPLSAGTPSLEDAQTFFAANVDEHSPVYQVVEVTLVLWRR